ILRSAEFGFLGVWVYTRVQTPRRWGDPLSAGVLVDSERTSRPLRTSCWIVGTDSLPVRPPKLFAPEDRLLRPLPRPATRLPAPIPGDCWPPTRPNGGTGRASAGP